MLKKNGFTLSLILAIALLLTWRFLKVERLVTNSSSDSSLSTGARPSAPQLQTPNSKLQTETASSAVSTLADNLNSPSTDIRADLRLVSEIVEAFRSNFPQTGNPVGNNAEITAILTGKNKLRLALVSPRHAAINSAGELTDRWGTPFFFHAESATRMEIRSAGPDKKMWNADDVVFAP